MTVRGRPPLIDDQEPFHGAGDLHVRTRPHWTQAGPGDNLAHAMRDGIPLTVWSSLADNEDAKGRVPRDPEWNPLTEQGGIRDTPGSAAV